MTDGRDKYRIDELTRERDDYAKLSDKLISAIIAIKLKHAPGCMANKCEACKNGLEAHKEWEKLNEGSR